MISKILIVADASKEALGLVLDAFQTIRKGQSNVKGFFISLLSEPFLKRSGSNILAILRKEEKEALAAAEDYFEHMKIFHHFEIINATNWQTVLEEVMVGDPDLIILQGEFLNICRDENIIKGSRLGTVASKCPILIINQSDKPSSTFYFFNREALSKEGANSTSKK